MSDSQAILKEGDTVDSLLARLETAMTAEGPLPPDPKMAAAEAGLAEALNETCELSLSQLVQIAQDHEIKPYDLLGAAEGSETCYVDYSTGHIRCKTTQQ